MIRMSKWKRRSQKSCVDPVMAEESIKQDSNIGKHVLSAKVPAELEIELIAMNQLDIEMHYTLTVNGEFVRQVQKINLNDFDPLFIGDKIILSGFWVNVGIDNA